MNLPTPRLAAAGRRAALATLLPLAALGLLTLAPAAQAGSPSPAAQAEINHLFQHLEASGCQFNRNGSWYDAATASKHLHQKYDTLVGKGLVSTAEQFIERGATQSSMSGQAYQVRCGQAAAQPSGPWFTAELQRWRSSHPAGAAASAAR